MLALNYRTMATVISKSLLAGQVLGRTVLVPRRRLAGKRASS
jgi:hypothetical protein